MKTQAELVNEMFEITRMYRELLEDTRLLRGENDPNRVFNTPPGQPFPGWYPIRDGGAGIVYWEPCILRVMLDLSTDNTSKVQLNVTPGFRNADDGVTTNTSYTLKSKDYRRSYTWTSNNTTSASTVRLPNGAPIGAHTNFIQQTTSAIIFVPDGEAEMVNVSGYDRTVGRGSFATAYVGDRTSGGKSTWYLGGNLKGP